MERQRKTAKNTSHNRRGRVKESKRSKRNRFGTVCIVIQTIASIALMIVLNLLGMIPLKYLILGSGITFFLLVYYFKFPGCEKKERYVWESF